MSGIAGVVHLDGRPADAQIGQTLGDVLTHRGPDGRGVWRDGPAVLVHRMLHTTPESLHERQPWVSRSGARVITADARVDNREDLCGPLGLPRDVSDSAVILAAYERWGEGCVDRLLGDFVFAIWDANDRKLFCARDHFGLKPLVYYHAEGLFVFGSEIKALLAVPGVPRRINELRVAQHLLSRFDDRQITFYQQILRLPPAHTLTVDSEGARLSEYWELDRYRELPRQSDEAYAEQFREIFTDAVRCRLRSCGRVGSMLSGGLDSSSITCTARRQLENEDRLPLATFSAIFPDVPQCDERPWIDEVLKQGGYDAYFVRADNISPFKDWQEVLWCLDEPFFAANLFIHRELYRAARESNVRVLLDGIDGDTTVSHGLSRLTELAARGRWLRMILESRLFGARYKHSPWLKTLRRRALAPLVFRFVPNRDRRRRAVWSEAETHLAERLLGHPDVTQWLKSLRDDGKPSRDARQQQYRSIRRPLIACVFETADRAAAPFALEARYPFFDKRLVEFCLALPSDQKLDRGWSRLVMRRAMTGILPIESQWRGHKTDLSPNFRRALRTIEQPQVTKAIEHGSGGADRFIRHVTRPHKADPNEGKNCIDFWRAAVLTLWLNQREAPRPERAD